MSRPPLVGSRRCVEALGEVPLRALGACVGARLDAAPARELGVAWVEAQRAALWSLLRERGALLLRGFAIRSSADFASLLGALGWASFPYVERSSPRTEVAPGIYSSTEYPPSEEIFFHNENSYAGVWPRFLAFYCDVAPRTGGQTPLSDAAGVFETLDASIREEFMARGILYVRNLGGGLGLSWQNVFQTHDRAHAATLAHEAGYETDWRPDGTLRTRRRAPALIVPQHLRRPIWFNHVALFHLSSMPAGVSNALLRTLGEDRLPYQVYYGDGGAIADEVVTRVRAAYRMHAFEFAWSRGDVLLLDNARVAHARARFSGPRRVLVSMSQPTTHSAVELG